MSALLPSWLVVIRHVAVHDVNSRYLYYYTSDPLQTSALFYQSCWNLANQWLTDSAPAPWLIVLQRVHACDLPDKFEALVEEFKDFVG